MSGQQYTIRVISTGNGHFFVNNMAEINVTTSGKPLCGNGELDVGKDCDDGELMNTSSDSNCTKMCTTRTRCAQPVQST
jgi:hypothetical protein